MKAWLQDGYQWKAQNLAGFCNWPVTRCFIQNDRARLIIEHSTNFALSGNIDGPCNLRRDIIFEFALYKSGKKHKKISTNRTRTHIIVKDDGLLVQHAYHWATKNNADNR